MRERRSRIAPGSIRATKCRALCDTTHRQATLPAGGRCCYRAERGRPARNRSPGRKRDARILQSLSDCRVAGRPLAWPGAALALDQVRFGKAVPNSFAFGAAEVGIQAKIFEQEGIDLQVLTFQGDARIQQALTADGIDVAVGSGPGLGFRAKGVPAIGVAAMYGPPSNLCLTVLASSPIKTRGRSQGQAYRRHHRGLAHRLADARIVAPAGLGQRRHQGRGARLGAGAARRHDARRARRLGDRIGDRLRARGAGQGPQHPVVRRHRQAFLHPCDLRHRRHDREAARTCCGASCAAGSRPSPSCGRTRNSP